MHNTLLVIVLHDPVVIVSTVNIILKGQHSCTLNQLITVWWSRDQLHS